MFRVLTVLYTCDCGNGSDALTRIGLCVDKRESYAKKLNPGNQERVVKGMDCPRRPGLYIIKISASGGCKIPIKSYLVSRILASRDCDLFPQNLGHFLPFFASLSLVAR